MASFKRLPNGKGTVTKEKGKRRNPYRAMVPVGKKISSSGKPYTVYKRIGSYATKSEAMKALMECQDITLDSPTFDAVFQEWKPTRKAKWSTTHTAAYNHLKPLHHRKIRDIKALDLEIIINSDSVPRTMKNYCSNILHGVYDYAVRHEYIEKNYAEIAQFGFDNKTRIKRDLFTKEEIDWLWERKEDFFVRSVLVMLYTGVRVTELALIKPEDLRLEDGYMVGGLKTEAGKNRIIPIHPDIMPLIKMQLPLASTYLFVSERGFQLNEANLYYNMRKKFLYPHRPHDTRHTYASQAYLCGMDENIIKRILGHSLTGVTQSVYIHISPEEIVKENLKFHF